MMGIICLRNKCNYETYQVCDVRFVTKDYFSPPEEIWLDQFTHYSFSPEGS